MVSNRCIMAAKEELMNLGFHFVVVDLGEVEIMEDLSAAEWEQLKTALFRTGLELMDDKEVILLEQIKKTITEIIYQSDDEDKINFSQFLSKKLNQPYASLASLFSKKQGTTIESFMLAQKVERVKELIIYGSLNFTEIAWKMNYSSVAHLSTQFKHQTGFTPTHFKQLHDKRKSLIEATEGQNQTAKNKSLLA